MAATAAFAVDSTSFEMVRSQSAVDNDCLKHARADVDIRTFGGNQTMDVTLKHGIEKTMRERIPEITAIRDATDHATGTAPYIAR